MKRSDQLIPLSREHHVALAVALVMRRADEASSETAAAMFAAFWRDHGDEHFAEEEALLANLAPEPGSALADAAERMRDEHVALRRLAGEVQPEMLELHRIGTLLHDHVRFEERELFPLVEAQAR